MVLSTPEGGNGPQAHNVVTRILDPVPAHIQSAAYIDMPALRQGTRLFRLFSAYGQPFWVDAQGWTPASQLKGDWLGPSLMVSIKGSPLYSCPNHVYESGTPDIGWVGSASLEGAGYTWDFSNNRFVRSESFDNHKWPQNTEDRFPGIPFTALVHTIEVEDHDSYFVGEHGLRVRHAKL
ncbi:MAG: hypothetical protein ACKVQK_16660 [Burkholderiales bacterium]